MPSFFLFLSFFLEINVLNFVMGQVFFVSHNFLGFPWNLRGSCYFPFFYFLTSPQ